VVVAIVGIGLSAVFMKVYQAIDTATYLQDKTLATWVALDRITELRLQDEFPELREYDDSVEMADIEWGYTVNVLETPLDNLRRINIAVYYADAPDNIIATAAGFIGRPQERTQGPVMPGGSSSAPEGNFR